MTHLAVSPAVAAARRAQERLERCLADGAHFRLEAGAGAGKTYSLVALLKKLIAERGAAFKQSGQRIACITYTEVARREIAQEIEEHPAILVDTIHGFAWSFLSRFQKQLRALVAAQEANRDKIDAAGGVRDQRVEYDLGFFDIDDARITLGHDDVPKFLAELLSNPKFRRIFENLYPILFIDEYQDTDPLVMDALSRNFFDTRSGPLIGLFGDHWQTIYRKEHLLVEFRNVVGVDKGANFRSVPAIVDVLNRLRPELRQGVDDEAAVGEARFFHCNAFSAARTDSAHAKRELPAGMSARYIGCLKDKLSEDGWDFDPARTKILMLTHSAIAAESGYQNLSKAFERNDLFAKKEDATIEFLADTLEPFCAAYVAGDYGGMFRLLGGGPSIKRPADKSEWREQMDRLIELRKTGTVGAVLDHLKATMRPRLSDRVARRESELSSGGPGEEETRSQKRHRKLRDVAYAEVVALVEFIEGYTPFATQHSVKGAEFENVLVILSGGWNHYNWPKYLELRQAGHIADGDRAGYYRARNLLYVALSRPKKRLAVLATQQLGVPALASATELFGERQVLALPSL